MRGTIHSQMKANPSGGLLGTLKAFLNTPPSLKKAKRKQVRKRKGR